MATRRRARPAMYELMKGQRVYGATHHAPAEHPQYEIERDAGPKATWLDRLRAGHSMRVPVGYLIVTIPAVLLLVVVAYIFGFSRGETVASDSSAPGNDVPEFSVNEPLGRPLHGEPGKSATPSTQNARTDAANAAPIRNASQALPTFDMATLGPIVSDPRQRDVTYFVLAETNPTGAERLARFCREHGLAAFVIDSRSDRFRKVIVLPGFDSDARSTEPVKELERLIREVGRKWKAAEPGATDLSDAYPQTHR